MKIWTEDSVYIQTATVLSNPRVDLPYLSRPEGMFSTGYWGPPLSKETPR